MPPPQKKKKGEEEKLTKRVKRKMLTDERGSKHNYFKEIKVKE